MQKNYVKIEAVQTPAWNRKDENKKFVLSPGDTLEGEYIGAKTNLGPRKDATIFLFQKDDGTEIGVWGSAILFSKLGTLQIGEDVKIEYKGDVQGKNKANNPYHDYDVWHTGTTETVPTINEDEMPTFQEQMDKDE
jgi:hypothetical protein